VRRRRGQFGGRRGKEPLLRLAVAIGRLAPSELERRYGISPDEFHDWQQRAARDLRATAAPDGRGNGEP
jgi:hypothetical protein